MVEVEDAVGGLGSVDTAQEFDVSVGIGSREVAGEAPVFIFLYSYHYNPYIIYPLNRSSLSFH